MRFYSNPTDAPATAQEEEDRLRGLSPRFDGSANGIHARKDPVIFQSFIVGLLIFIN